VPTRADRPYGSFPRGHHDVAPDPGAPVAPEKARIGTAVRRALPWTAVLAGPALLLAISLAPAPRPEDVQPSATPTPAMSDVYAKVAPSVVQIKAQSADGKLSDLGSGVVIDDAGDILTALHVVQNAQRLTVVFADGTESSAVIISEVAESDIAALRPANTPAQLQAATLGNPSALRIGDDATRVTSLYGTLARADCPGNYYALTMPTRGGVNAFYVVNEKIFGFGLLNFAVPACR